MISPLTARLYRRMADHLISAGRGPLPMEEEGLEEAARAATDSAWSAWLAEVNAPPIIPGETREQYADRLRERAGATS